MGIETKIVWNADCFDVWVAQKVTTVLFGKWDHRGEAEAAVQKVCEQHFTQELFDENVGMESDWTVNVEVLSPPEIAGKYEVELERVTRARAKQIEPAEDEQ